jgi:hypothetical protein
MLLPRCWSNSWRAGLAIGQPRLAAGPPFQPRAERPAQWPRQADAYLDDHFGLRRRARAAARQFPVARAAIEPPRPSCGAVTAASSSPPATCRSRPCCRTCGAWWPEAALAAEFSRERIAGSSTAAGPGARRLVCWSSRPRPSSTRETAALDRAGLRRADLPLAEELLNRLPGALRPFIAYPRDIAATLPAATPLVPPHNFHWQGAGIHAFLGRFAERELHLTRHASPIWAELVNGGRPRRLCPGGEAVEPGADRGLDRGRGATARRPSAPAPRRWTASRCRRRCCGCNGRAAAGGCWWSETASWPAPPMR